METAALIADLVDSLAWPIVALIIVVLLRDRIPDLLKGVRKIRFGPAELEFEKELVGVASSLAGNPVPRSTLSTAKSTTPADLIRFGYDELLSTLRVAVESSGVSADGMVLSDLIDVAQQRQTFDAGVAEAIRGLARMNNLAQQAPSGSVRAEDASEFSFLVREVLSKFTA